MRGAPSSEIAALKGARDGRSGFVAMFVLTSTCSIATCSLVACLVDVDESVLDRVAARDDASRGVSVDATHVDAPLDSAEPYVGMPCGSGRCMPPYQVCCTGGFGNPNRREGSCDKAIDCASGDYWECMSPRDCDHTGRPPVCCAKHFKGGGFSMALCQASCETDNTILCDPNAPSCPPATRCVPSSEFPELYECR